ncbi:MAG TPA: serine hydrolase [Candidatus Baltobacteraceae bacterium]|nr:serine hydrolase [Candidatus Baltobacteraceae bacterium]
MMNRTDFLKSAAAAAGVALLPGPALAKGLHTRLLPAIQSIPGSVGVCARTMANGASLYSYNAGVSFPSASTIKMLIMLTAFTAAEDKPAAMKARVRFDAGELIGGSDFMSQQPDGATFSVHELLVPMIQVSDNTASNMLISHFGFELINTVIRRAGLHQTALKRHFLDTAAVLHHMDNRTTPSDMAHLLYQIERGSREEVRTVASPKSCRQMIEIMLGQTDRDTIPRLLPPGLPVANKTGELSRSRSDVAIIDPFGDSPYVLAVYTNGLDSPGEAYDGIARISRIIYGAVAQSDL